MTSSESDRFSNSCITLTASRSAGGGEVGVKTVMGGAEVQASTSNGLFSTLMSMSHSQQQDLTLKGHFKQDFPALCVCPALLVRDWQKMDPIDRASATHSLCFYYPKNYAKTRISQ